MTAICQAIPGPRVDWNCPPIRRSDPLLTAAPDKIKASGRISNVILGRSAAHAVVILGAAQLETRGPQ